MFAPSFQLNCLPFIMTHNFWLIVGHYVLGYFPQVG
jgi:hypothetical protein